MSSFLKPVTQSLSTSIMSHSSSQGVGGSPTGSLSAEYTLAVETNSYRKLQKTFHKENSSADSRQVDVIAEPPPFEQILQPDRESVQQALSLIEHDTLSHLLATCFEYTEHLLHVGILLYQNICRARLIYAPIHELLNNLPLNFNSNGDSLSLSQCILAFNVFLEFDRFENPFMYPDAASLVDLWNSLSQLKLEINHYFRKSRSKLNRVRRVAFLAACRMFPAITPSSTVGKGRVCVQMDAAARGIYVLLNDLDTIARLMSQVHTAVEGDKQLVDLVLERGVDPHVIQEILNVFRRNFPKFAQLLRDCEEHLCLYFSIINRTRRDLLQLILSN